MKAAAFTIALLLSGTAIAQTSTDSTVTGTDPAASGWSNSTTATTTDTTMTTSMAGGQTVAPGNMNPRRDARGIPVISAAAVAPAGYNGTADTGTGMGGPLLDANGQTMADTGASTQPCTRTVTDHCLQTYERSRRR